MRRKIARSPDRPIAKSIGTGLLALVMSGCAAAWVPYKVSSEYDVHDPRFVQSMGNIFGPRLVGGNTITTLVNGDEIFPAMLAAIHSARTSITFESFNFLPGEVSASFARALAERAKAGVRVHVILDYVGGGAIDTPHIATMKQCGAEVCWYEPLRWWQGWSPMKVNFRTHRKLLVIDGKVGFIGGVGIADRWQGDARNSDEWRDNHYRVDGPIVAQIQAAFLDNWIELTGDVLHGDDYFPLLKPAGDMRAQVIKSSTSKGDESVQLMYLMSLAAARKRVCLATAYFVPDDVTMEALKEATGRGVKVQVIVPGGGQTDSRVAHQASRARWGELLKAGVEIYVFEPTMYHVKLMIVDDLWVSIGSANLDNRSFTLNDEANMNVLDAGFAAEQVRLFEADLARSRRVTYEDWARRPFFNKLLDGMSTLLDPLL